LAVWRFGTLAWARRAAALSPVADVYHGHDLTGLPAAAIAADRRGGLLIYDSHELFLASGAVKGRPAWAVGWLDRLERRLVRRSSAVVTVNDEIAALLRERFGLPRVIVVHNCPPRATAERTTGADDRLRTALGLEQTTPLAVYHGGFRPDRGLEQLLAAFSTPTLRDVHLVFMGFGPLRSLVIERSRMPTLAGRVHVLDPVPPEAVVDWIRGADCAVMPIQRDPPSYRLSTPNKLFEALAAGLPIVGPDSPGFRRIVLEGAGGPLGVLCDPADPAAIAAAVRSLLDRAPAERQALRDRCRSAVLERWNWEREVAGLIDLYAELEAAVTGDTRGTEGGPVS
jgi:glycosyltransferase involved in cell wall biosynthesis